MINIIKELEDARENGKYRQGFEDGKQEGICIGREEGVEIGREYEKLLQNIRSTEHTVYQIGQWLENLISMDIKDRIKQVRIGLNSYYPRIKKWNNEIKELEKRSDGLRDEYNCAKNEVMNTFRRIDQEIRKLETEVQK